MDLSPARALAGRYKLALPARPVRGISGDVLSSGVGSSVEFQDFRPYVPGDDPRYIDWAALARTDQLILRLHRADVRLSLDILLDASRSLGLEPKGERAAQTALLLALLGRRMGARATVWIFGDEAQPVREAVDNRLADLRFEARASIAEVLDRTPPRFEAGSLRFVLSDFLFPHDPFRLQACLARGAGGGAWLQFLLRREQDPPQEGYVGLEDVETGEERQMAVTTVNAGRYQERLRALQEGLSTACRTAHLPWAVLPAESALEDLCRGPLARIGLLEPV